jgi:hypothetical protein
MLGDILLALILAIGATVCLGVIWLIGAVGEAILVWLHILPRRD